MPGESFEATDAEPRETCLDLRRAFASNEPNFTEGDLGQMNQEPSTVSWGHSKEAPVKSRQRQYVPRTLIMDPTESRSFLAPNFSVQPRASQQSKHVTCCHPTRRGV